MKVKPKKSTKTILWLCLVIAAQTALLFSLVSGGNEPECWLVDQYTGEEVRCRFKGQDGPEEADIEIDPDTTSGTIVFEVQRR